VVGFDGGPAAVGLGDGGDQGEAESGSAGGPGRVGLAEPLEGSGEELRGQAGSVVTDRDLDAAR
jgi:hypothetical protein